VSEAIPLIAAAYDEPFGNASAVPTYCCARMARADGKTLLLAGDGGDELFGGNARYAKQKLFEWYQLSPSALRDGLIEPLLLGPSWLQSVPLLRKARSYVQQARIPLPDRLETYNFLEREVLTDIFEPEFLKSVDPREPRNIAREAYRRAGARSPVNCMMHLDLKETLADNDLRKVNGMCELAGIEVRYPMLDDDLVAFSGRLSPAQKVKGLRLRYFFKEALKDFLAPETIVKTKHGFGLPFGLWLQRDAALRQIAVDNLVSFKRRGYVRPDYLDRLLDLHGSAHASYFGVMIWIIMMLEQWFCAHDL
jgi:asparagine synthase (glutamine-hydrolysing)